MLIGNMCSAKLGFEALIDASIIALAIVSSFSNRNSFLRFL